MVNLIARSDFRRVQHMTNCDRMARAAVEYRMRAAFDAAYDGH